MRKLTLKEIQKIELDMLKEVANFCKENNIRYYLAGGTLLGAIRHKGFIPWDDDIDINMPRPDYEKFIKIFKSKNKNYAIKSNKLNNFSAPFTKIVDTRTWIDDRYKNGDIDVNIWIDIFPVDGLPENVKKVKQIYIKIDILRKLMLLCDAKLGFGKNNLKKYSKYILKPIALILGKEYYCKNIEKIALKYSYDQSKFVGAITWGLHGVGEMMLKEEYEKSVEVEFEQQKFSTFSCWHTTLLNVYGDYMKIPPIENRQQHDMVAYWRD